VSGVRAASKPVRSGLGGDLAGSRLRPDRTLLEGRTSTSMWRGLGRLRRESGQRVPALGGRWTAGSSAAARLSVPVLIVAALAGPAGAVVALSGARSAPVSLVSVQESPDLVARRVAAEETALGWVQAWLTASASDPAALKRWWSGTQLRLPVVGSRVSGARVLRSTAEAPGVWSVLVAADVVAPAGAAGQRRYFQVPVAVSGGELTAAARALTIPAEVPGPGGEATVQMDYSTGVPVSSAAGATVAGFLTGLLTGSGDLTRWAAPANPARPVTPAVYRAVVVQSIVATGDVPGLITGTPADGTSVALLVTADLRAAAISAGDPTGSSTSVSSPTGSSTSAGDPTGSPVVTTGQWLLTVTARAGRWEVASLDVGPAVTQGPVLTSSNTPT